MDFDIDLEERRKEAAAVIAKRKALAANIAELKAKREAERPKVIANQEAAINERQKALASLKAADDHLLAAGLARDRLFIDGQRIEWLECGLAAEAAPEIDVFITWCRDDVTATRAALDVRHNRKKHFVTGEITFTVAFSNEDSVSARIAALGAAIERAELLKLEPDQGRMDKRLAEIRKSIPSIQSAKAV